MPVSSPVKRHAGLALAIVVALSATLVLIAPAFAASLSPLRLSTDPYTNTTSQHKTEVEPDTFSYGSTIVSTFQAGRFYDGGSSNIGWATSTDNGQTWHHGFLPGTTIYATPKGPYARISDPSVAYDPKDNVWIITTLALNSNVTGVAVIASRSTDGGLTWQNPVIVAQASGFQSFDKDWIACDVTASSPFYGHCYVEWDDNGNNNLVLMSTSTDGGMTWGTPQTTPDHACVIGGQPVVQPGGTVIVPIDDCFESSLLSFTSTNGGASWSSTITVTAISSAFDGGNIRSGPLPSAEVDGAGTVYVVWEDCRFESGCGANDIVMTTTTDGIHWTPVQRVPADPIGSGVDHFIPGIAVDRSTSGGNAHIGLTFYFYPVANCSPSTCQLELGYVSSTNGGQTWSAKMTLTPKPMKVTWLANTNQGYMVGDYISTSILGGRAFPVVAAALPPRNGVFNEAMYTAKGGLPVTGGAISAVGEHAVSSRQPVTVTRKTAR